MGHGGVTLTFTNRSGATCRISGYPGVALLDASGHKIADAARTPSGYLGGLASSSDPPPILELRQGDTASAMVEAVSQGNGGAPCPAASALEVTPPGETHSVRVTAGLSGCSPEVHPVVPGTSGRAGQ